VLKKYLILFEKVRHYSVFFRRRTHNFLLSVYGLTKTFISGFHKIESLSNNFFSITGFRDESSFSVYEGEEFFLHEV